VQAKASPEGVCCPRCGALGWKVASTKPHKSPGVIAHTYACKSCGLKEEVLVKSK
jgi:transcription elongation factor Elf1